MRYFWLSHKKGVAGQSNMNRVVYQERQEKKTFCNDAAKGSKRWERGMEGRGGNLTDGLR